MLSHFDIKHSWSCHFIWVCLCVVFVSFRPQDHYVVKRDPDFPALSFHFLLLTWFCSFPRFLSCMPVLLHVSCTVAGLKCVSACSLLCRSQRLSPHELLNNEISTELCLKWTKWSLYNLSGKTLTQHARQPVQNNPKALIVLVWMEVKLLVSWFKNVILEVNKILWRLGVAHC